MKRISNNILFGKYEILSTLGAGSFGTVYLSKHLTLDCYRAIKLIPKSGDIPTTILSEAQILKSLRHPGIPIIYDIEEDSLNYYMIEEYIEGIPLEEFLLRQSSISQSYFLEICLQLCDIFQYLHTVTPSPVLYLDLKPEHIIVCESQLKLIDFNVATFLSNLGNICNLFGNVQFSAPELFHQKAPTVQCDVYSIGKIMEFIAKYSEHPLPPNIHHLIQKAAHADISHRFETVDALISAIRHQQKTYQQPHLCKTIAICGSHPGCGCTHIAISIVSILNQAGYPAVYCEHNSTKLRTIPLFISHVKETDGQLHYRYFTGYPNYGPGITLPNVKSSVTVHDYGSSHSTEAMEADLILYICNDSLWHMQDAIDRGESLLKENGTLTVLCNMGHPKSMSLLSNRLQLPVRSFPVVFDPFDKNAGLLDLVLNILGLKRRPRIFSILKNVLLPRK